MGGGRDRHQLTCRIEAGRAQRGDDVGEMAGVDRAHVEPDRLLASLLQAGVDRARHFIARGELVDEALAGGVVQGRALAPDRLGDQESLSPGHADHGGWMELQQLEICQRRPGGVGEHQPDALRAGRVGRACPQRRGAAC